MLDSIHRSIWNREHTRFHDKTNEMFLSFLTESNVFGIKWMWQCSEYFWSYQQVRSNGSFQRKPDRNRSGADADNNGVIGFQHNLGLGVQVTVSGAEFSSSSSSRDLFLFTFFKKSRGCVRKYSYFAYARFVRRQNSNQWDDYSNRRNHHVSQCQCHWHDKRFPHVRLFHCYSSLKTLIVLTRGVCIYLTTYLPVPVRFIAYLLYRSLYYSNLPYKDLNDHQESRRPKAPSSLHLPTAVSIILL